MQLQVGRAEEGLAETQKQLADLEAENRALRAELSTRESQLQQTEEHIQKSVDECERTQLEQIHYLKKKVQLLQAAQQQYLDVPELEYEMRLIIEKAQQRDLKSQRQTRAPGSAGRE